MPENIYYFTIKENKKIKVKKKYEGNPSLILASCYEN